MDNRLFRKLNTGKEKNKPEDSRKVKTINIILSVVLAVINTFVSTVVSGGLYTILLFTVIKSDPAAMAAYVPIVSCTAILNAIIVGVLYLPLMKVLKKDVVVAEK